MRVSIRFGIFSTFIFVTVLSLAFLVYWISDLIRPNYMKLVEENLVDTSRILAADLSEDLEAGMDAPQSLKQVFDRVYAESFESRIYDVTKSSVDLVVYVTDAQGVVTYHSSDPSRVSMNYANWINVSRTLRGEYGARATRNNPEDPASLNLHVSAPVMVNGQLAGVLSVEKPITWATIFIKDARNQVVFAAVMTGGVSLVLALLMSAWLLRPIGRLTQYARNASEGKRAYLPRAGKVKELQDMAQALQVMHKELEDKQYVAQYIQSLTHEIKSPVSAIRGAAELINDNMSGPQRERFLSNIKAESERINRIVDRLLELSAVEKMKHLENVEELDLVALVRNVLKTYEAAFASRHLRVETSLVEQAVIHGDAFLISQAVGSIFQNAVDFSPEQGLITVSLSAGKKGFVLEVQDEGSGIPEFALSKIYDRFFSMPRPSTNKKSSGLGLAFVKEIIDLHEGSVSVRNRTGKGVSVLLEFKK